MCLGRREPSVLLLGLAQERAQDRDLDYAGGIKGLGRLVPAGDSGLVVRAVGQVETDGRSLPWSALPTAVAILLASEALADGPAVQRTNGALEAVVPAAVAAGGAVSVSAAPTATTTLKAGEFPTVRHVAPPHCGVVVLDRRISLLASI